MKSTSMNTSLLPIVTAAVAAAVMTSTPALAGDQDQKVIVRQRQSVDHSRVNTVVVDDDRHVIELRVDNKTYPSQHFEAAF